MFVVSEQAGARRVRGSMAEFGWPSTREGGQECVARRRATHMARPQRSEERIKVAGRRSAVVATRNQRLQRIRLGVYRA